jgi:GNAT superfamily N-acetyltransferase
VTPLEVRPITAEASVALRQRVLRPHQRPEELILRHDAHPLALHVGVFEAEALLGVGRTGPEPHPRHPRDGDWRIRGMAVEPEAREAGVGALVLRALIDHARESGGRRAWCNARTGAAGFYARADFRREGEEFEVPDVGPHVLMSRSLR